MHSCLGHLGCGNILACYYPVIIHLFRLTPTSSNLTQNIVTPAAVLLNFLLSLKVFTSFLVTTFSRAALGGLCHHDTCHNRTKCHSASPRGAHRGRLSNPQQGVHNNPETKGMGFFSSFFSTLDPLFHSGRAAPAFLPACRAESCLYRAFPHSHRYNNTRPHPPDWPCHAAQRQTPRQTGPRNGAGPTRRQDLP